MCVCVYVKTLKTELQGQIGPLNYGTVKTQKSMATYRTLTEGALKKPRRKEYHILLEKRKQGNQCQESGTSEVISTCLILNMIPSFWSSHMCFADTGFLDEKEGVICFPK